MFFSKVMPLFEFFSMYYLLICPWATANTVWARNLKFGHSTLLVTLQKHFFWFFFWIFDFFQSYAPFCVCVFVYIFFESVRFNFFFIPRQPPRVHYKESSAWNFFLFASWSKLRLILAYVIHTRETFVEVTIIRSGFLCSSA